MIKEQNFSTQRALFSESLVSDYTIILQELVDNAIDSQAGRVYVQCVFDKNKEFSCFVADDGHGIKSEHLADLCNKGTTTKISSANEVNLNSTAGFRGEALSAISYMADVTIFTKRAEGGILRAEYSREGKLKGVSEGTACHRVFMESDSGTMVKVDKAFSRSNIKNRVNKEKSAEKRREIKKMFEDYLLANCKIDFDLVFIGEDGFKESVFGMDNCREHRTFKERMKMLYSASRVAELVEFKKENIHFKVEVMVSANLESGSRFKKRTEIAKYFVNGRAVENVKSIEREIKGIFMKYNKAGFVDRVVQLEVAKGEFDLNMNAKKNAVSLLREGEIVREISEGVEKSIKQNLTIKRVSGDNVRVAEWHQRRDGNNFVFTKTELTRTQLERMQPCRENKQESQKEEETANELDLENKSYIEEESKEYEPKEEKEEEYYDVGEESEIEDKKVELLVMNESSFVPANLDSNKKERLASTFTRASEGETNNEEFVKPVPVFQKPERRPSPASSKTKLSSPRGFPKRNVKYVRYNERPTPPKPETVSYATKEDIQSMKILSQFNKGFILAELKGNYFLFDQHACDERINYERLKNFPSLTKQILIKPMRINSISKGGIDALKLNKDKLKSLMFDVEFTETSVILSSTPSISKYKYEEADFLELAQKLELEPEYFSKFECLPQSLLSRTLDRHIATVACRMSIMIGKGLTVREMKMVVENLAKCKDPWHCSHGRPTLICL